MRPAFPFACGFVAVLAFAVIGCGGGDKADGKDAKDGKVAKDGKKGDDHNHPEHGPHGGDLIELGDHEYHGEMTHDEATHTVTIYILDSTAKKAVPVDAKELVMNLVTGGKTAQFTLPAKPLEGEADGKSSRFELADEKLMEAIEAEGTKGRFNVNIAGKEYTGNVEHHHH